MATDSHGMGIELPADSTPIHQFPGVTRNAMERVAELLAGDVTPGVAEAIAEQVGPAVDAELAAADLVKAGDARLPVEYDGGGEAVLAGITDADGRRTWIESAPNGRPTDLSASLIVEKINPQISAAATGAVTAAGLESGYDAADDVLISMVDATDRRTDLEVRQDGHFPQRVVDNFGGRMDPAKFSQSFKDQLATQVAGMVDTAAIDPAASGYDVILMAGQSNMSGRGTPYDQRTDPPHARVWQWGSSGTYAGVLSQAVEPLAMVDTPSGIGPGLNFARWYAGIIPTNRQVLLVAAAQGGQAIVGGTWDPDTPGSNAQNSIARANAAMAYAGANARFAGILWVQGETDGDNNATGAQYQAKFDTLANRWRTEIAGAANAPIVLGGMVPEYLGTGTRTAIDAVHQDTPHRLAYTAYAPGIAGANLGDGNHYNATGARKLGRGMFDAYLTARSRTTTI
jgi:hypothetical protein